MALNATQEWWVRADGDETNGGGYDAAVSGAGTNYSDQAAAQLSLTDLATTGVVATLTSVTGGFTSQMVGNIIRIASGTNFTPGYYMVVTFTNGNTVVLDRAPTTGAGVSGVGKLGGAHADIRNMATSGSGLPDPLVASPLDAGHTVHIRGGGSDQIVTPDYDLSAGSYRYDASGTAAAGRISWVGYNGRPLILCEGQTWRIENGAHEFENIGGLLQSSANLHTAQGLIVVDLNNINSGFSARNLRLDANGNDLGLLTGYDAVSDSEFTNSGGGSAGTAVVAKPGAINGLTIGCTFDGLRGPAVSSVGTLDGPTIERCTFSNLLSHGIVTQDGQVGGVNIAASLIAANTFYNVAGDAVRLEAGGAVFITAIYNNIFYGGGAYAINCVTGSATVNDKLIMMLRNNAFGSNTSGNYHNLSAGTDDVTLTADPFTNAAGGDFTLNNTAGGGAAARGAGYPGTLRS